MGHASLKCMYCGEDIVVSEAIGSASHVNIANLLQLAKTALDTGNNEEAYKYYTKVLEFEVSNSDAWYGRASASGWSSTLGNLRTVEMLACFERAIETAPADVKELRRIGAGTDVGRVCLAFYSKAKTHMLEFISLDDSWPEYLTRCEEAIHSLERAHTISPQDANIIETILLICKDNIEGAKYIETYPHNHVCIRSIAPEYEEVLRKKLGHWTAKMKALNPQYEAPEIKKVSRCFVATAAAGNPFDPSVVVLRRFRDQCLERSLAGRIFIRTYELLGPRLAVMIERNQLLRIGVYRFLVRPAARLIEHLQSSGRLTHN